MYGKKLIFMGLTLLLMSQVTDAKSAMIFNTPDSAFIFAYTSARSNGGAGLQIAWSIDKKNWHSIGAGHSFVRCDYGRWGSQKKMYHPYLIRANDGLWHCVWTLNESDGAFAHASSRDLINWKRQSYPLVMENGACLMPVIEYNGQNDEFTVAWKNPKSGANQSFYATTKDFKTYTPTHSGDRITDRRQEIVINGNPERGTVTTVPWTEIDAYIRAQQIADYRRIIWGENSATDPERFARLQPVNVTFTPDLTNSKKISDMLMGIFFEDINYAADGGIYAELVQNRGFEYALSDKEGRDTSWHSRKAWFLNGHGSFDIDATQPIHPNNKHYAIIHTYTVGAGLANEGFGGMVLKAGDKYDFSVFARTIDGKHSRLKIRLTDGNGKVYGEALTGAVSSGWEKYNAVLTANETTSKARLEVIPQNVGSVAIDMVSLFPQKTFKGRKNGLRSDLAQAIADMKPRFVRFPGGCVAHGDGIENMYRWENTIGPLEARKPQRNIWNYHQTGGLGYFEYFQFCKDIGAEPVPIVPAGVPCQNSAHYDHPLGGQQCGIPMDEMDEYVQSILNLIEWANGDAKNSVWGRKRAEAGHREPFNLKYLGIGNEDQITDVFEERFTMIFNAVKEKYPEIEVIGTAGPFIKETTDYVEGWQLANQLDIPIMDEHYYQSPGWYIHNQDYYDSYDRSKAKVYVGEYAAHLPGRPNNIETALAEALHLTSLERNGDVVLMSSYAPLLAKEGFTQWNPDLIYFNNTEVKPTVGYYVQQLFGQNVGDEYIHSAISLSNNREDVKKRVTMSLVRDSKTNDLIAKWVNLLPTAVNISLNLHDFTLASAEAVKTVLSGAPDDRNAKPETSTITVSEDFKTELSAYSLTVVRIKTLSVKKDDALIDDRKHVTNVHPYAPFTIPSTGPGGAPYPEHVRPDAVSTRFNVKVADVAVPAIRYDNRNQGHVMDVARFASNSLTPTIEISVMGDSTIRSVAIHPVRFYPQEALTISADRRKLAFAMVEHLPYAIVAINGDDPQDASTSNPQLTLINDPLEDMAKKPVLTAPNVLDFKTFADTYLQQNPIADTEGQICRPAGSVTDASLNDERLFTWNYDDGRFVSYPSRIVAFPNLRTRNPNDVTEALQSALEKIKNTPELNTLYIPAGVYLWSGLKIHHWNGDIDKGGKPLFIYTDENALMINRQKECREAIEPAIYVAYSSFVTVSGRGIHDGQGCLSFATDRKDARNTPHQGGVMLKKSKNLTFNDTYMRDGQQWNWETHDVVDVELNNIKGLSPYNHGWLDGLNLSSGKNVTVNGSITLGNDDAFATGHYNPSNEFPIRAYNENKSINLINTDENPPEIRHTFAAAGVYNKERLHWSNTDTENIRVNNAIGWTRLAHCIRAGINTKTGNADTDTPGRSLKGFYFDNYHAVVARNAGGDIRFQNYNSSSSWPLYEEIVIINCSFWAPGRTWALIQTEAEGNPIIKNFVMQNLYFANPIANPSAIFKGIANLTIEELYIGGRRILNRQSSGIPNDLNQTTNFKNDFK